MTDYYYKKAFKKRLRDAFTKTFGQIYAEYSRPEKVGYWIAVVIGFGVIVYVWVAKLK